LLGSGEEDKPAALPELERLFELIDEFAVETAARERHVKRKAWIASVKPDETRVAAGRAVSYLLHLKQRYRLTGTSQEVRAGTADDSASDD
jgi:hypothetical protein